MSELQPRCAAPSDAAAAVHTLHVLVSSPAHTNLPEVLSYQSSLAWPAGTLVRVPLGARELLGVVWDAPAANAPAVAATARPAAGSAPKPFALRDVCGVLAEVPALNAQWRALISFAARYYQRHAGELAQAALPPALRSAQAGPLSRRMRRLAHSAAPPEPAAPLQAPPLLSAQQTQALADWRSGRSPFLLWGSTGSGKTEVYLHASAETLASDPQAQVLVLVPEINLTPQLLARFAQRLGAHTVVALHSGLSAGQRLSAWLAAHTGQARVVLGTRLAVLASLPGLRLIVVDEEHDPSYKSHDGARYSARDLAIWRAHQAGIRVILGSATPALESWAAAQQGRYQRLDMPERIGAAALPQVRLIDMSRQPKGCVLAPALLAAIAERAQRGEQSLLLLNRRGYAPVLRCPACDWKSQCPHCSAYRVFHKIDRSLRCHHCGWAEPVPRACPDCGNLDIQPVGRGTEQLQEQLVLLLAEVRRSDGGALRVARIDADTTRAAGSLQAQLQAVHAGEVDVLVGTQMLAKGHDFRRISLVAAVNPDGALFSADFRGPERLFALLMQAGGRAGRDVALDGAEMWVQTYSPQHALYTALARHDYAAFAASQLNERRSAGLPPYIAQALLRAEAHTQAAAQAFLQLALQALQTDPASQALRDQASLYSPVPMPLARVADVERAQLLIECASRTQLQRLLALWARLLPPLRRHSTCRGLLRWAIDVDPQGI